MRVVMLVWSTMRSAAPTLLIVTLVFVALEAASAGLHDAGMHWNVSVDEDADMYLAEARDSCTKFATTTKCAKYKVLKYVADLTSAHRGQQDQIQLWDSLKLVTVNRKQVSDSSSLFAESQPRAGDSELDKVFRFFLRRLEDVIRGRAFVVDLQVAAAGARGLDEDGPRVLDSDHPLVDDGRGKKKKVALLLPLVLFMKIKALLVPILLGVLFIKKLLVLGAIFLPGLLSFVKFCKPHSPHHGGYHTVHTAYSGDLDSSGEFSSGYGGHYKDYSSRRVQHHPAYRGYHGY